MPNEKTTLHYVTPKEYVATLPRSKCLTACGRRQPRGGWTIQLLLFIRHRYHGSRCQECYDNIDPLEILNMVEL